ncbi:MAG: Cna B-type domain-containing protein, partial [Clostridia bacterium]|nr:Cna B-type domain-containing protein [Clostridia bacterium]
MKKRRIGINILLALILSLMLFAAFPAAGALADALPEGATDINSGPDDNPGLEGQSLGGQSLDMQIQCVPCPPQTIGITVKKTWSGIDAAKAPAVTVVLEKKSGKSWGTVGTATLSNPSWSHTFTGLEKDKTYRVRELTLDGFESSISPTEYSGSKDKTFTITNKVKKIKICVTKEWSVKPGKGSTAVFTLYSKVEGAAWVAAGSPLTLTTTGNGQTVVTGCFKDLPLIDENGNAIDYKVEETSFSSKIEGYDFVSSTEGLKDDGDNQKITFENTKVERIEVKFQKSWVDLVNASANRPPIIFNLYA